MKPRRWLALLVALAAMCPGCRDASSEKAPKSLPASKPDAPLTKPQARHPAEFIHRWPSGGSASTTTATVKARPYHGFDGHKFKVSNKQANGLRVEVEYGFEFVEGRDAKDIYRITRRVRGDTDKGGEKTITIEYAGEEVSVFDDEIGSASIGPIESP